MASPTLLFHTIRHLRPTQVVSRAYYRLADRLGSSSAWNRRSRDVEIGECEWHPRTGFLPPVQQRNSEAAIGQRRFRFQNDERFVGSPIDWNLADAPLLWRYNLHYFDYLWSLEFDAGREIAEDWINRHVIGRGQVGWSPYPTSLRLLNWCGYFFGSQAERTRADSRFTRAIQESIGSQTARLSCRLEYHLLGNHLLENAAALVFVGSCFDGPDARRWLDAGLRLLRRELQEQILSDGMHFELSPMYHSRVLYLLLSLMNIVSEEVHDWLGGFAAKMLDALACTCHPDGKIALFNDSAMGVYNPLAELAEFARRLGVPWERGATQANTTFALSKAGYYGARTEQGHSVVCDAGKVGPDYIPGHAHGDIFSFELSLFGDRLVVDSGVYDYLNGEMRGYCRSTAAHNTVEIGGRDQCEFWDAFKVARRGRPYDVQFQRENWGFRLSGWHDGYRRLPGRPTHHREFQWFHEGILAVRDTVDSSVTAPAVSRIHLHPECLISEKRDESLVVERGGRRYTLQFAGGKVRVGTFWYCPEFGIRKQAPVIELRSMGAKSCTAFRVAPSDLEVALNIRADLGLALRGHAHEARSLT
jgi:uncharacterized heparinase superfamily protein